MLLSILADIAPVFLVIGVGFLARRRGFLPDVFMEAANRLVYYLAVPLLVFSTVSAAPFAESFRPREIAGTTLAVLAVALLGVALGKLLRLPPPTAITFAQNGVHGNTGYIALAMVLYVLGEKGMASAGVLAGMVMLVNNTVSLALFQLLPRERRALSLGTLGKVLGNPIVAAALLGLLVSATRFPFPPFAARAVGIVGDMALPLGLLIIGGSLRSDIVGRLPLAAASSVLKLLLLPAAGLLILGAMGIPAAAAVPAVILLGSPSATISYVMAREMGGDHELAAAGVTVSTMLSIVTYTFWLALLSKGL